jgi:hypothetical protein
MFYGSMRIMEQGKDKITYKILGDLDVDRLVGHAEERHDLAHTVWAIIKEEERVSIYK